jgi:hypothetical protein
VSAQPIPTATLFAYATEGEALAIANQVIGKKVCVCEVRIMAPKDARPAKGRAPAIEASARNCGAPSCVVGAAAQGTSVSTWQPIESAPEDEDVLVIGTLYNMLVPDPHIHVAAYRRGWWSGNRTVSHVSHWMPLPPMPSNLPGCE